MADGLFLVGTDRDVGKTMIAVALVGLLRKMGVDATMMTPITTGGALESAQSLLEKIGIREPKRLISPILLETLASPLVASRVERKELDLERIWTAYNELRSAGKFVVVEGGGLMVPITPTYSVADLLQDFDLPSIIIGKSARGTLNHCFLTLRMMQTLGSTPLGFILNGFGQFGEGFAEALNPEVLEEIADPLKVLAIMEWRPENQGNPEAFIRALSQQESLMSVLRDLVEDPTPTAP